MAKKSRRKKLRFPYRYDPKIRAKAKAFEKRVIPYIIVNGFVVPILLAYFFLSTGTAGIVRDFANSAGPWFVAAPIFGVILAALLALVELPGEIVMYYIKRKFKLVHQKLPGRLFDYLKGTMLSVVFAATAILGLYHLILSSPTLWWLYAGLAFFVFTLVIEYLFPKVVTPLFYKTVPYKDARQRKRLLQMLKRAGVPEVKNVLVAKESKKSKIANAFFTGLGNTKQMVLFDNLINNFTSDEVETVVAHELGHYVNKDVLRGALVAFIPAIPTFYIADFALRTFGPGFGIAGVADIAGVALIYLVFLVVGLFVGPFFLAYSRRMEAQADMFALNVARKPLAQASTERRLSDIDLADESPPRILELLFWTHPAPERRVKMAVDWAKKRGKKLKL